MDYQQASALGDIGERRVTDILAAEASALGQRLLNNLLLVDDRTTAQLDHVLVDRFGILVVETKNYRALMKGKSDDRFWTACYSGGNRRRDRFLNPLRQNDRHREILQRVLGACGRNLPATYVQSLVVFAGGNLNHLGLDDHDQMRVLPDSEVVDYLRARSADFPPNPGALDAEQVSDLVSLLQSVNKADDPTMVELHAENVRSATRRFGDRFQARRRVPSPAAPANPYGAPVVYRQDSRYPDGSQHMPARHASRNERLARELLWIVVGAALVWWIFFAGGLVMLGAVSDSLISLLVARTSSGTPPRAAEANAPPASVVPAAASVDVAQAKRALKESAPNTYKALVDPSHPKTAVVGGLVVYQWDYLDRRSAASVQVKRIQITLDSSGRIVGVTSP